MRDAVMPQIVGLEPDEERALAELMAQWRRKLIRNEIRSTYYDMKNVLKDLEISIPPHMKDVETVFGWPAKAVDMLATRCKLEGFTLPDGKVEDFGIPEIMRENRLRIEAPQAHRSSLTHSVAFVTTTKGDKSAGEPDVLVTARSAKTATGIWSPRLRRLTSALAITDSDVYGASELTLYFPTKVVIVRRDALKKWEVIRKPHALGRVPVEPLPYRPDLDRPLGRSRISRAVMSITDSAVRTALRTEVSAEFFAAPQRYALGVDMEAFMNADGTTRSGWESVIGRLLAIGRDEDGNLPTVGTFAQQSMEPHLAQLRQIATRFSGETGIPVDALGVVHDANPTSAEMREISLDDLVTEAEATQDVFGEAWVQTMRNAVRMRDGSPEDLDGLGDLEAKWRPAKTPSKAAAADATVKLVTAFPWLAETEVALEYVGYDRATIARLMAEKRRNGMKTFVGTLPGAVSAVNAAQQAAAQQPQPAQEQPPAAPSTPPGQ